MKRWRFSGAVVWALIGLFLLGFAVIAQVLRHETRPSALVEMQVALPRAVQVIMSAGDRYFAANLASFRALVASTAAMTRDSYQIQARVQSDAAWLNPGHEDNYYIATAILPWQGEIDSTQYILSRATAARPFDWQPAFYYAFNELTFHKSPVVAAEWLRRSANATTDELQKMQLMQLAARWVAKSDDPKLAIALHRSMARETRHKAFAVFLEKRAQRLELLESISNAAVVFARRKERQARSIDELVREGLLSGVPVDPFGADFALAPEGKAIVQPPRRK